MSGERPAQGARGVASLEEYERRLRMSMMLMDGARRDSVIREIVAGVEEQVRAAGGDFARVAPALDDPKWVGKQMAKVYGISEGGKAGFLAVTVVLAVLSVPGVTLYDSPIATLVALLGFAALVLATYRAFSLVSGRFALLIASTGAAVRIELFFVGLGNGAPIDVASGGEVTLFVLATAMLVVVAVLPALASRSGADEP
jgi:hypothetical protein